MTEAYYTCPSEQTLRTMDLIYSDANEYTQQEIINIAEATRLVMQAAIDKPDGPTYEWSRCAMAGVTINPYIIKQSVNEKSKLAEELTNLGILISDEKFFSMLIDNEFIRPSKTIEGAI